MGHLFSRAFRRFTQCSQSSSAPAGQAQQQQPQATSDTGRTGGSQTTSDNEPNRAKVQSIPVGQSIDSAEYSALVSAAKAGPAQDKENTESEASKPQVEEAVIKIQALVRGHLTRKALKDAQQQQQQPAGAAQLGQSQFDEESLTRNRLVSSSSPAHARSPLLESIAEDSEVTLAATAAAAAQNTNNQAARLRLSPLERVRQQEAAEQQNGANQTDAQRTDSPVPSEANVSIDLHCETPTSASIDILDHHLTRNQPPVDQQQQQRIAAVLHLNEPASAPASNHVVVISEEPQQQQRTASLGSPEISNGSAELAAIRIQSAFRGYKTRKHSPYRRRRTAPTAELNGAEQRADLVPNGTAATAAAGSQQRNLLRQQDAQDEADQEELEQDEGIGGEEEKSSRLSASALDANDEDADQQVEVQRESRLDAAARQDSTATVKEADTTGDGGGGALVPDDRRVSIPTTDEAAKDRQRSIELDLTDSSNLGAALSFGEDSSLADEHPTSEGKTLSVTFEEPAQIIGGESEEEDEEEEELSRSVGANLVADELNSAADSVVENRPQQEPSDSLEVVVDDDEEEDELAASGGMSPAALVDAILDEQEMAPTADIKKQQQQQQQQLSTELESDDIERRDPRGQASETGQPAADNEQPQPGDASQEAGGAGESSGHSSPAIEENNSHESDESSNEQSDERRRQQQTAGGQSKAKNKRRQRNKKKGKK